MTPRRSPLLARWLALLLCVAASLAVPLAHADDEPPARVGRLSLLQGEVSFYGDRDEGWERAALNHPVTSENSLWTRANARAEIRIGPSAIRLDDETLLDVVRLDDELALTWLQRGTLNIRLRRFGEPASADALSVDTGLGRILLEPNGRYRLDATDDGDEVRITVFAGRARFEGGDEGDTRLTIDAGRQLTARGGAAAAEYRYENARESLFDRWAAARDADWDRVHTRYAQNDLVSPHMTGYEDLDAYGEWIDDGEYGRVWTPRAVVVGWAPYRYGRWSYVRPWGWTWIDDAPWGFAPFHYGRWVQVRSRWCWWPGPYVRRPVYAPALVAWVGGTTISIGGVGSVGWFPLAPREHYIPHYTRNIHYHRRLNHLPPHMNAAPPPRYRNQVPGATVVANTVFANGNPVARNLARFNPGSIAVAPPTFAPDVPRPPRQSRGDMPDRRQGEWRNQPRPRFVDHPGDTQPPRRQDGPKFRTPEPTVGGPEPATPPGAQAPGTPPRGRGPRGSDGVPPGGIPQPAAPPPGGIPQPAPVHSPVPPALPAPDARTDESRPSMPDRDRSPRQRPRPQPAPVQVPAGPAPHVVTPPPAPAREAPQHRAPVPPAAPAAQAPRPAPEVRVKPAPEPVQRQPREERGDRNDRNDRGERGDKGDRNDRNDGDSRKPRTNKD